MTGTTSVTTDALRSAAIERIQHAHNSGMPVRVLRRRFHLSPGEVDDIVGKDEWPVSDGEGGY